MADGDAVNLKDHDRLWDREGREWSAKWSRWTAPAQARSFVMRERDVVISHGPSEPLRWVRGAEAAVWWAHARNHFEVPGASTGKADEDGFTWAAHVFCRGEERLLVIERFC